MLNARSTICVLIDVQEKLARAMHRPEALVANLEKLLQGLRALQVPVIWMEQNPLGLGPTLAPLARLLEGRRPMTKLSFSCCRCPAFEQALARTERGQVLLAGIEGHVCVYQTARDLLAQGYEVDVVADAISSRTPQNHKLALRRMSDEGAGLTGVEMCLFELLGAAEGPAFKEILAIVK